MLNKNCAGMRGQDIGASGKAAECSPLGGFGLEARMCKGCLGVAGAVYGEKSEKCSIRTVQACIGKILVHQARRQSAYPWAGSALKQGCAKAGRESLELFTGENQKSAQ